MSLTLARAVLLFLSVALGGCYTISGALGYARTSGANDGNGVSGNVDMGFTYRTCALSVGAGMGAEWSEADAHVVGQVHGSTRLKGHWHAVARVAAGSPSIVSLFFGAGLGFGMRATHDDGDPNPWVSAAGGIAAGLMAGRIEIAGQDSWFAGLGVRAELGADLVDMLSPKPDGEDPPGAACN